MLGTRSISTAGKATPGVSARPRSRWVRQGLVGITDSLPAGDEEWYSRASSGRIFMNADLPAIIIPCSLIQQVAGNASGVFHRSIPLLNRLCDERLPPGKSGAGARWASGFSGGIF